MMRLTRLSVQKLSVVFSLKWRDLNWRGTSVIHTNTYTNTFDTYEYILYSVFWGIFRTVMASQQCGLHHCFEWIFPAFQLNIYIVSWNKIIRIILSVYIICMTHSAQSVRLRACDGTALGRQGLDQRHGRRWHFVKRYSKWSWSLRNFRVSNLSGFYFRISICQVFVPIRMNANTIQSIAHYGTSDCILKCISVWMVYDFIVVGIKTWWMQILKWKSDKFKTLQFLSKPGIQNLGTNVKSKFRSSSGFNSVNHLWIVEPKQERKNFITKKIEWQPISTGARHSLIPNPIRTKRIFV